MAPAIERWEYLIGQDGLPFSTYANFITTYEGFPQQDRLQRRAEAALDRDLAQDDVSIYSHFRWGIISGREWKNHKVTKTRSGIFEGIF